ncbi:MAG: glycerol-3-phosphate acyltransferase [Bellilinea sp.]
MSEFWMITLTLALSYTVGAIPFGLLIVWIFKGKDVRLVESGRTGGTNAMRAAGFIAGLLTAGLDVLKGYSTLWIVSWLAPGLPWVNVTAALMAILGHNYSIFLIEKRIGGGVRLRGGAGGAPAFGGAMALWAPAGLIILPLGILVYIFIGYASVTTMSIGLFASGIFLVRAIQGLSPWEYVFYGLAALIIVMWALRPNLARLRDGTERSVGLRAYLQKRQAGKKDLASKVSTTRPSRNRRVRKVEPYSGR